MPFMTMEHEKDPKKELKKQVGSLADLDLFNNQVLCAVYIRPEKTKSGIYIPGQTRDEDRVQSKVGLVLKKGPQAFVDETNSWFSGVSVEVDDWIFFRPSDGWSCTVNGVLCRILDDTNVRGKIGHPDEVW